MDPTVDPTVDLYDQTAPVSNCDWARIRSVRFVMTARSGQPVSGDDVTAGIPTWAGSVAGNPTGSASNPIDLSQTTVKSGSTWRKYRYKVFETIIPIRNITLLGGQIGC
jgi:type IV pilus assembly protein PilW